ncbi:MATE family efflux transporter, partial [Myxococcota bacterium]|nr:MATE family efflux transporter [Myxococcota bacterium]
NTERLERFLANPQKAVWTVALPMMAGMMIHVLYTVVDTAFIGQLGHHALASLTIVFPLVFVLIAIANGIGSGISVIIAQSVGRRDAETAERTASLAISLGMAFGLLFLIGGLLGGRWMVHQLGATDIVADGAWEYFSVLAFVAPLMLMSSFLRFVLTGEGDAKTPMMVMGVATLVNIALDPIFIFVLDWGIRGAALATGVSQILTLAIYLYLLLWRQHNVVKVRVRYLLPRLRDITPVLRLGVPASLNQIAMAMGILLLNRIVVTFGDESLAGFGAGSRVDSIVSMPILGLAAGASAVIAMFAGANRADLVRQTALHVYKSAFIFATTLGVIVFAGSSHVMALFTSDPATTAVGQHYLAYMVFVYPLMSLGMVSGRLLLGIGYPMASLSITVARLLFVAVPIAFVSVVIFKTPIDGVWAGILAGAFSAAIISFFLVRHFVWHRDPTQRARTSSKAADDSVSVPVKSAATS